MSRFVRASKYRHVFGQPAKKEYIIENVKVTNNAWDTNIVAASGKYLSINWNASGGGAFAILPLPSPFGSIPGFPHKLPDTLPLARSHTASVLDTDWSPHDDSLVASGGDDGKLMIWKVDSNAFDGWGSDHWVPKDFDPVWRIDASPRKVGQVLFHPTASNVLASATGDYTVKLWDLARTEDPRNVLSGHNDAIQSLAFNSTGTLLVTTCRDRKLRLFDPRAGSEAVRVTDGHGGIKGARVVWMGEHDRIATTGFSKMSERQVAIWETGSLANVKTLPIDQSSGVMMPFWSDNNILFLGEGAFHDGNIRYYEYEADNLIGLDEHKTTDPQRGMCFLPRRSLNVSDCEIARAYKIAGSNIEPIAFIVPRKADGFQSDIFPPAPSYESSMKVVDLSSGASFASSAPPSAVPTPAAAPAPTPVRAPSMTQSASLPSPASAPQSSTSTPFAPPMAPSKSYSYSEEPPSPAPFTQKKSEPSPSSGNDEALIQENNQLKADLREARELIRNLELQVETQRANARKAAQALLDAA
ncbi:DUF1900-domain-containing protein [Gymnopus androsaceus JB14]|uniref:Coronin n=1 Tax=Gymnopus androsaceus JB14 TaxID=1447944 RepID=A0A6A4GEM4_9AGAR|nr:DUF1900-domain-containing protein [Gymnopus androsaceus JB14]